MSSPHKLSFGVLEPADIALVSSVFNDIRKEPWFPTSRDQQDGFAAYMLLLYRRGVVSAEKLERFCREAAQQRFLNAGQASGA